MSEYGKKDAITTVDRRLSSRGKKESLETGYIDSGELVLESL